MILTHKLHGTARWFERATLLGIWEHPTGDPRQEQGIMLDSDTNYWPGMWVDE